MSAPTNVSDLYIEKLVNSKKDWINSKLNELKSKYDVDETIKFIDRKYISFLGKNYKLSINEKADIYKCELFFKDNKFIGYTPKNMSLENKTKELNLLAINLIIDESTSVAKEKVLYFSKLLNVFPQKIQIKDQKSSWETCSSLGNIYLNWRVFLAPIEIVDYVIIHELCHLKHMNHSPEFWDLVSSVKPNYKECRNWLKDNGYLLNI